jgi:hypothetical protein
MAHGTTKPESLMIRREMIRRVERLETRLELKRPRLQFMIRFLEPDGTVARLALTQ